MTRIGHQQLTVSKLTGVISYDRTIEYLVLYNNNPVPLYIRLGSPEIPTQRNYDIAVPPNYIMGISVDSNQFGFRLGDDTVTLALVSGVTVIEGLIDEPPPALGGVPIQGASLATSDLGGGVRTFAGAGVIGIFNLTLWGGLLFNLFPSNTSGQGVVQVDISSDGVTFIPYSTYAFWQSIPFTLLLPRIGTFVRFTLNTTTIVGEPAIAGSYTLRGTLAEVTQIGYTPNSTSIVKTWAIAASGSQQFSFVTSGLPAVSISAIETSGGATPVIQLLIESSSDNVNWRVVTSRVEFLSTGVSLYRSFGNLGIFIRVTVSELGGAFASNGSLYMSIPAAPDTAGILNTIYKALGDQTTAVPVGSFPDMWHQLDAMRIGINTADTNLSSIITNTSATNTALGTVNTNLGTINTSLGNTGPIVTALSSLSSSLSTLHNDNIVTISPQLSTINTSIQTIAAAQARAAQPGAFQWVTTLSGTYYTAGSVLVPGDYLTQLQVSASSGLAAATCPGIEITIGTGTNAAVLQIIYRTYLALFGQTGAWMGTGPVFTIGGTRSSGLIIPAGHTDLWGRVIAGAPMPVTLETALTQGG